MSSSTSYSVSELRIFCTYDKEKTPVLTGALQPVFFTINIQSDGVWDLSEMEKLVFLALTRETDISPNRLEKQAKITNVDLVQELWPTDWSFLRLVLNFTDLSKFSDLFAAKQKKDRFVMFSTSTGDFTVVNSFMRKDVIRQVRDRQLMTERSERKSDVNAKTTDLINFLSSMKTRVQDQGTQPLKGS